MRMRKKKNLAPRMEACGAYLIRDPFALRGRWRELMPEARELRVELGCGKGGFTVGTAAAEPEVLLVAGEKVPDAMVVAMEKARGAGLRRARRGRLRLRIGAGGPDPVRMGAQLRGAGPQGRRRRRASAHDGRPRNAAARDRPGGKRIRSRAEGSRPARSAADTMSGCAR